MRRMRKNVAIHFAGLILHRLPLQTSTYSFLESAAARHAQMPIQPCTRTSSLPSTRQGRTSVRVNNLLRTCRADPPSSCSATGILAAFLAHRSLQSGAWWWAAARISTFLVFFCGSGEVLQDSNRSAEKEKQPSKSAEKRTRLGA